MFRKLPLSLILSISTSALADANINSFNLRSKIINGTQFNRSFQDKFRGQEAELFSLELALKTFLGDSNQYIESLEFTVLKLLLQNKFWYTPLEDKKISILRESFCRNWDNSYEPYNLKSKTCFQLDHKYTGKNETLRSRVEDILNTHGTLSQPNAVKEAKNILDDQFLYESHENKLARLINYRSGRYEDFPSDVIFSTIYPQNAAIYGDTILIFKDQRSVDLSYFNGEINGAWGIRGDAGELITPGYIKPNELKAIILRKRGEFPDKLRRRVGINTYASQQMAPVEYVFVKKQIQQKNYVFIYDGRILGKKSYCVRFNQEGTLVHCKWTSPNYMHNGRYVLIGHQEVGPNTNYHVNLIGALTLDDGTEVNSQTIFKDILYFSKRKLNEKLQNSQGVGEPRISETIKNIEIIKENKSYKLKFIRGLEK